MLSEIRFVSIASSQITQIDSCTTVSHIRSTMGAATHLSCCSVHCATGTQCSSPLLTFQTAHTDDHMTSSVKSRQTK